MKIALEYEGKLRQQLEKDVGFFEAPVDTRKKMLRSREMPIGNFAADALLWRFKTDVGLYNSGNLRGDKVYPAGPISSKTLEEIFPYGNDIDVVTVTGDQLRRVMELSGSALIGERETGDYTRRVPGGGFLQVAGLRVLYDLSEAPTLFDEQGAVTSWGTRMKELLILKDGEWREVEDDREYTVALSSWLAQGGDRYFVFQEPTIKLEKTDFKDLDVMADYLLSFPDGRVLMKTEGRITIKQ